MYAFTVLRDRLISPVAPPYLICGAMILAASVTHHLGAPDGLGLIPDYFAGALAVVITSLLIFVFVEVAKLARFRADRPLQTVVVKLRERADLLVLPLVVFPVFLASFTATKSGIQRIVGFRYDSAFSNIDAIIFGTDPWRITHALFGSSTTSVIEFFYAPVWIAVLAYSKALIALFARRELVWTYFSAVLLTWFIGGFMATYALSAAGPTFANLADGETAGRFLPLKLHLLEMLPAESAFLTGPAYLQDGISSGQAYYGGGISAMPSMHIAAVTLYVLAARATRWHKPAIAFAAIIFVGSVHSGYHYAIDGMVAVALAYVCWCCAERVQTKLHRSFRVMVTVR